MAITMISKNKYRVVIEAGYDDFGKRRRISKTVNGTEIDAKIMEGDMLSKVKRGESSVKNKDITVKELSDRFIELYCKRNIRPVTTKDYQEDLNRINKIIGDMKVSKVNSLVLDKLYSKLAIGINGTELGYHSKYNYYKVINVMFNKAIDWGYIEINPNRKANKPKKPKGSSMENSLNKPYNPEQVRKLLNALKSEKNEYQTVITLGLDSGLRASEVAGLLWENIDFEKNTVKVEASLKIINRKVYRKKYEVKSFDSYRTVEVSQTTMDLLKQHHENQQELKKKLGSKWIDDEDYVFRGKNGKCMSPDRPNKILEKIYLKNNLEHITFHGLRHTCASILIQNRIDPKTVSQRLGHSDTSITMDIYNNVFEETKSLCAKKFEEMFKE